MKKMSVCGKGGSGKSAIVTLLAKGIRDRGYRVLVVDSDESNPGLYRMLGFERPPSPLMDLLGGKMRVEAKLAAMVAAGKSELELELMPEKAISLEDIPSQYLLEREGIRLVMVGKIHDSLEGCACPMGLVSREFLRKLRLDADEVALVDMEAGIEHFGRGVGLGLDSVLVVIDPSFESVIIAERVSSLAAGIEIGEVWAVLNKVTSEELATKLTHELEKRNIAVIGSIHYDPEIFEADFEGRPVHGPRAAKDVERILDSLLL
jgi:CO dehydrogenase maturation factor